MRPCAIRVCVWKEKNGTNSNNVISRKGDASNISSVRKLKPSARKNCRRYRNVSRKSFKKLRHPPRQRAPRTRVIRQKNNRRAFARRLSRKSCAVAVTSDDGTGDAGNKRGDHGTNRRMVQYRLTVGSSRNTDMGNRSHSRDTDTRLEIQTRFQRRHQRWNSAPKRMQIPPRPAQSKAVSSFLFHLPKFH